MLETSMKRKFRTVIITLSDKGATGLRIDESGPEIRKILEKENRYEIIEEILLPDKKDLLEITLVGICDNERADLILTTGGTGFSPRDITPEATLAVADRNAPGISEYMRFKSMEITPKAMLSRGVSVIRKNTLIINLPGSPKSVRENLSFILSALPHGLEIMLDLDDECGETR